MRSKQDKRQRAVAVVGIGVIVVVEGCPEARPGSPRDRMIGDTQAALSTSRRVGPAGLPSSRPAPPLPDAVS